VIAEIHPDNSGSQRVAEKLGLRRIGVVSLHGAPTLRYSMTLAEWSALQRLATVTGKA
jgi:RimJ/RimL family protein N-acetyltransferase